MEEAEWRLKSGAIWLVEGDEGNIFFQNLAKYWKHVKTIWDVKLQDGSRVSIFHK